VAGLIIFVILNTLIIGEGEANPYLEMNSNNLVKYRSDPAMDSSGLFLTSSGSFLSDISDEIHMNSDGYEDIYSVESDITGNTSLHILWFGDSNDLYTREISVLRMGIRSIDVFTIQEISFVVLADNRMVGDRIALTSDRDIFNTEYRGNRELNIEVDRPTLGSAKNMQSGEISNRKGCLIVINFPQGLSAGDVGIDMQWGPNYYHETTLIEEFGAAIMMAIVVAACILIYFRMAREEEALIVITPDDELSFFGYSEDLRKVYYEIAKITIPRMKKEREEEIETGRPGISMGSEILNRSEAREIGKRLKSYPGGSGKMIIHQCPECGGNELYFESGFMTGYVYHCKNCDYVGSLIFEKEIDFSDEE